MYKFLMLVWTRVLIFSWHSFRLTARDRFPRRKVQRNATEAFLFVTLLQQWWNMMRMWNRKKETERGKINIKRKNQQQQKKSLEIFYNPWVDQSVKQNHKRKTVAQEMKQWIALWEKVGVSSRLMRIHWFTQV